MPKRKMRAIDLRIGMYVEQLDRPWLETDFLFQGLLVVTQADIDDMVRQSAYVYVSEHTLPADAESPTTSSESGSASHDGRAAPGRHAPRSLGKPAVINDEENRRPTYFFEEVERADHIRVDTRELISDIHRQIRAGQPIDLDRAQVLISHIADSVARNSEAMLWFTTLKNRDDYTAQHSMHVCMLSLAFGHYLQMSPDDQRALGIGALLHDIGKIQVPLDILNKPGRLTDQETAEIRKHPRHGFDLLRERPGLSADSLDVVLNHHERMDGSGYPSGLPGEDISLFSQILAICDVYDALTSDRVYHAGRSPCDAIKLMRGDVDKINLDLLDQFVACIGRYPTGTLVELNTGEVGLVVPRSRSHSQHDNTSAPDQPTLLVILDHDKQHYYPQRVRDLARFERFEIVRVLPSGAFGVNIEDYAYQFQ